MADYNFAPRAPDFWLEIPKGISLRRILYIQEEFCILDLGSGHLESKLKDFSEGKIKN